jgi:ABC-type transport system involved in multi-copper enzyme maturation permease subunit
VVDTFSLLHQPLVAGGSVTARVSSLTELVASGNGSNIPALVPWAKAGILIENSTSQGSAYAAVMVTPSHGVRMQYNYTHDTAGLPGPVSASAPRWLRLTRAGDLVTGYDSLDGANWAKIGTAQLTGLAGTAQAGLFVTSPAHDLGANHSAPTLATAAFGDVHLSGDFPRHSWDNLAEGANTQTYPTQGKGPSWFRQSGGTFTISGSGDIAPQVAGGDLGGSGGTTSLLASGAFGLIAVTVLATLFITSEYRRGLIRATLTASPRRGRALAAKAIVISSVTFVTASIATAIAEAVSRHVLYANGNYVFPLSALAEVRAAIGTGLLFATAAVLVLALGTILRRSAGAVATGIVVFVLPFIVSHPLSPAASGWLFRATPTAAFAVQGTLPHFAQVSNAYTMQNGYYPLGPWAGLAVLAAYAAVAFGAAVWLIRRRDV